MCKRGATWNLLWRTSQPCYKRWTRNTKRWTRNLKRCSHVLNATSPKRTYYPGITHYKNVAESAKYFGLGEAFIPTTGHSLKCNSVNTKQVFHSVGVTTKYEVFLILRSENFEQHPTVGDPRTVKYKYTWHTTKGDHEFTFTTAVSLANAPNLYSSDTNDVRDNLNTALRRSSEGVAVCRNYGVIPDWESQTTPLKIRFFKVDMKDFTKPRYLISLPAALNAAGKVKVAGKLSATSDTFVDLPGPATDADTPVKLTSTELKKGEWNDVWFTAETVHLPQGN